MRVVRTYEILYSSLCFYFFKLKTQRIEIHAFNEVEAISFLKKEVGGYVRIFDVNEKNPDILVGIDF